MVRIFIFLNLHNHKHLFVPNAQTSTIHLKICTDNDDLHAALYMQLSYENYQQNKIKQSPKKNIVHMGRVRRSQQDL